jgi:hypothetical protein
MKPTIAQLQEKIKSLEEDKNVWYGKYRELKDADEKRNQIKMTCLNEEQKQTDRQVVNLMEIIRWQINPKTAESPFRLTKSERDDNSRNF